MEKSCESGRRKFWEEEEMGRGKKGKRGRRETQALGPSFKLDEGQELEMDICSFRPRTFSCLLCSVAARIQDELPSPSGASCVCTCPHEPSPARNLQSHTVLGGDRLRKFLPLSGPQGLALVGCRCIVDSKITGLKALSSNDYQARSRSLPPGR